MGKWCVGCWHKDAGRRRGQLTEGDESMPDTDLETVEKKQPQPGRWQGLLAAFLVSGSAQFFGGRKAEGAGWFAFFVIWPFAAGWLLASPIIPGVWPGFIATALLPVAWLVMLGRSYCPVVINRKSCWLMLALLFPLIPYARVWAVLQVAVPFYHPAGSMEPTLRGASHRDPEGPQDGDHVVSQPSQGGGDRLKRGDVIVFSTDEIAELPRGQVWIKRVIGLPGETLSLNAEGRLQVNGIIVNQPDFFQTQRYHPADRPLEHQLREPGQTFEVPEGHIFVMGDNSAHAYDSRFWGALPVANVLGHVTKTYWPLNRAGLVK